MCNILLPHSAVISRFSRLDYSLPISNSLFPFPSSSRISQNPSYNPPDRSPTFHNWPNDTDDHTTPNPNKTHHTPTHKRLLRKHPLPAKQQEWHEQNRDTQEHNIEAYSKSSGSSDFGRVHRLNVRRFKEIDDIIASSDDRVCGGVGGWFGSFFHV